MIIVKTNQVLILKRAPSASQWQLKCTIIIARYTKLTFIQEINITWTCAHTQAHMRHSRCVSSLHPFTPALEWRRGGTDHADDKVQFWESCGEELRGGVEGRSWGEELRGGVCLMLFGSWWFQTVGPWYVKVGRPADFVLTEGIWNRSFLTYLWNQA